MIHYSPFTFHANIKPTIMKKVFFVFITLAVTTHGFAQSEKFTKAMTTNLSLMDSAKTADDMLAASAAFERIGDAEKNQSLPYYYASHSQVLYGFMKNDATSFDALATKAEQLLAKAD